MHSRSVEIDSDLRNFDSTKTNSFKKSHNETANYEDALEKTGSGKFNYKVLLACGLGLLATGFQNGVTAYLLPSARCDLKLTTTQMGLINVAFMTGGIMSACLWGIVADMVGRRAILVITIIADATVTFVGTLSRGYYSFALSRMLSGFFIGGPGCLIFTYLGDLIPAKQRTKYICYVGFCFIASWILLPAIALLIIPLKFELNITADLIFNSWRLYLCLLLLPHLLAAYILSTLPESPRLLLVNGHKYKALEILRHIFTTNTGRPGREFLVKQLIDTPDPLSERDGNSATFIGGGRMSRLMKSVEERIATLFREPHTAKTIIVMIILFANMFGCYGLGLWIPELLSRFRRITKLYPDLPCTICYVNNYNNLYYGNDNITNADGFPLHWFNATSVTDDRLDDDPEFKDDLEIVCDTKMDSQVFKDTLVIGLACIIYNLISAMISSHVNLKVLPAISLAVAGGSAIVFVVVTSPLCCLLAASVFQSAMMTGNIVIVGMIMDVFPAKISSMAVCMATLAGRMGSINSNLFFGLFLDYSCLFPIILVAVLSLGGAVLIFFVKEIKITDGIEVTVAGNDKKDYDANVVTSHM